MSREDVQAAIVAAMAVGTAEDDAAPKRSQRDRVIEVGLEAELWCDPDANAYATMEIDGHLEHHALRGRAFKLYLLRRFSELYGRMGDDGRQLPTAPGSQALAEGLSALEARAVSGAEFGPAVRVSRIGARVYLDLGRSDWSVLEVDESGWRRISRSPVKFVRPAGLRPLPDPAGGGSVEGLREFLNLGSEDDFKLLVAWLVAALGGRGPFPILVVNAEQGAGKSTLCRVVRRLIDPNQAEVRSAPGGERDLVIAARNAWLISLDNISHVGGDLSDALCRIATGSGFATRALYTNGEEFIVNVCRPQVLNGIPDLAQRPDLADRSIVLSLPALPDGARRTEGEFWKRFDAQAPLLLGALLDGVSMALQLEHKVQRKDLPRMADFAVWAEAAGPAFGWAEGEFLDAYRDNLRGALQATVEADAVSEAVRSLMEPRENWKGSTSELLDELNAIRGDGPRPRSWPSDATRLSGRLRRAAPGLRKLGLDLNIGRVRGRSRILIEKITENSATSATEAEKNTLNREARGSAEPPEGSAGWRCGVDSSATNQTRGNPEIAARDAAVGGAGGADPAANPKWELTV